MQTDPAVMAELGGPVPAEEIPALHRRRLESRAADPWWFVIVTDGGEPAGEIGIWETEHGGTTVHETGWMLARPFHGRGLGGAALALLLDRAPSRASSGCTRGPASATRPRTRCAASSALS